MLENISDTRQVESSVKVADVRMTMTLQCRIGCVRKTFFGKFPAINEIPIPFLTTLPPKIFGNLIDHWEILEKSFF